MEGRRDVVRMAWHASGHGPDLMARFLIVCLGCDACADGLKEVRSFR
jgi:hypothetical protein